MMDQEDEVIDERPAKKARFIESFRSPSPSAMSDAAYDDEDDLYDSPAIPQLNTGSDNHEEPNLRSRGSEPPDQFPVDEIPGLGLQASNGSQSLHQNLVASGQITPFESVISEHNTHDEGLEASARKTVDTSRLASGLVHNQEAENTPRRSPSTAKMTIDVLPPRLDASSSKITETAQLDKEFLRAAQANKGEDEAEWQYDSSDAKSASSSSSDSSDESDEDGFQMLSAEQQAKILMQEGGGSDDEGVAKSGQGASGRLRTANEKPDEIVEKPNIVVTPDMEIRELGTTANIAENYVLVKGSTSGETRVLESGSLLCLEDRSVIGVISEPLGRVEEPHYSIAFSNAGAIQESRIEIGTRVFYVLDHATYVFTQPLKNLKGSDASNLHDEEVGAEEIEFSDDEAEAEYKRNLKQERQRKKFGEAMTEYQPAQGIRGSANQYENNLENISRSMVYDDEEEQDDLYTPLARPANLHEPRRLDRLPPGNRGVRGNQKPRGERNRRDRGRRSNKGARSEKKFSGRQGSATQPSENRRGSNDTRVPSPSSSRPIIQHSVSERNLHSGSNGAVSSSIHPAPPNHHGQEQPFQPYAGQFAQVQMPWGQNPYAMLPNVGSFVHNQPSPLSPVSPGGVIPPGAFVNPAFFRNQPQSSTILAQPNHQQSSYTQPNHVNGGYVSQVYSSPSLPFPYQQHGTLHPASPGHGPPVSPSGSGGYAGRGRSPESDAAFHLAQEKLNLIRELHKK